ncbi:Laccase-2 [Orbilia brochopaga]|nr:Laccase-2 [Drechslerella brochopaga]
MLLSNALWGLLAATAVSAAPSEMSERSALNAGHLVRRDGDLLRKGSDPNKILCKVNNKNDRSQWSRPWYNLKTDYEDLSKIPNTGVTRKYTLVLTNKVIAQDGYATNKMVVNDTYPGPTLEGCWGDIFEITVINNLNNGNGTAIHWHGVQQLGTNHMDGAAGVAQCPIPPGGQMTYRWRANQYGTSWYHSHFALQYTDGVVGPIIIHGPSSGDYDEEYLLMLTDWYHKDAFGLFYSEVFGGPPAPDSKLLNGKWQFPCNKTQDVNCAPDEGGLHQITFKPKRRYKLRLVNMSTATMFSFWLQDHDFEVVQADFVPIHSFTAKSINIAIAQRYDIIVQSKTQLGTQKDFWINMQACNAGIAKCSQAGTGIIRYDPTSTLLPPPDTSCTNLQLSCLDTPKESLVPYLELNVPAPPPGLLKELYPSFNSWPDESIPFPQSRGHKWSLGTETFFVNWTEPVYSYLGLEKLSSRHHKRGGSKPNPRPTLPSSYQPIYLDKKDQWLYLVIAANFTSTDPAKLPIPVDHPIHLHGHDFVVLAQVSKSQYDPRNPPVLNRINPARRDTATLPGSGYLVIAFQAKNPGAWLVHCHIAFHSSGGLAMQILELEDKIISTIQKNDRGYIDQYKQQCKNWRQAWQTNPAKDASLHDSGA